MAAFLENIIKFSDAFFDRFGSWSNRLIPIGSVIAMLICIPYAVKQMRPVRVAPSQVFWPDSSAEKISIAADTLFGFNESKLTDDGRAAIQKIAADLKSSAHNGLMVVGHTDHFGDVAGNKRLATARARSVRDELVKTVPPANVAYVGVGSQSPLTLIGECPGKKPDPETLKCNAKDRRVEIWLKPD
jgi:outer membrane protein OmpA-like peptidoglycan-associated protein